MLILTKALYRAAAAISRSSIATSPLHSSTRSHTLSHTNPRIINCNMSTSLSAPSMPQHNNPAQLTISSTTKLASGHEMPVLGFGVYQVPASDCPRLIQTALSAGYRYIDTATSYRNESACASAVLSASTIGVPSLAPSSSSTSPTTKHHILIPRSSIFFTTKLPPRKRGYAETRACIQATINENPGLEGYIDLYLIHAPFGGKEARLGEWEAMRDEWKEGRVRSLGVSNFSIAHMEEIQEWIKQEETRTGEKGSGGVISVGQWEVHPWCSRHDILTYCHQHNISVQAYCPLVRGIRFPPSPSAPSALSIAPNISTTSSSSSSTSYLAHLNQKYQKTPAQILLRWSLDMGLTPVVKSVHEERIIENAGIFGWGPLEEEEVRKLDTRGYEPCSWDPVRDCKD